MQSHPRYPVGPAVRPRRALGPSVRQLVDHFEPAAPALENAWCLRGALGHDLHRVQTRVFRGWHTYYKASEAEDNSNEGKWVKDNATGEARYFMRRESTLFTTQSLVAII